MTAKQEQKPYQIPGKLQEIYKRKGFKNLSYGWTATSAISEKLAPLPFSYIIAYAVLASERSSRDTDKHDICVKAKEKITSKLSALQKLADELVRENSIKDPFTQKVSKDVIFLETILHMIDGEVNDIASRHKGYQINAEVLNRHYQAEIEITDHLQRIQERSMAGTKESEAPKTETAKVEPKETKGFLNRFGNGAGNFFKKTGKFFDAKARVFGPGAIFIGTVSWCWDNICRLIETAAKAAENPHSPEIIPSIIRETAMIIVKIFTIMGSYKFAKYALNNAEDKKNSAMLELRQKQETLTENEATFRKQKISLIANDTIYLMLMNGYVDEIKEIVPELYELAQKKDWRSLNKIHDRNIRDILGSRYLFTADTADDVKAEFEALDIAFEEKEFAQLKKPHVVECDLTDKTGHVYVVRKKKDGKFTAYGAKIPDYLLVAARYGLTPDIPDMKEVKKEDGPLAEEISKEIHQAPGNA